MTRHEDTKSIASYREILTQKNASEALQKCQPPPIPIWQSQPLKHIPLYQKEQTKGMYNNMVVL